MLRNSLEKRRIVNGIALLTVVILLLLRMFFGYKYPSKRIITNKNSIENEIKALYEIPNKSIENLSVGEFCNLLEFELNDKKIGDVKDKWQCYPVWDNGSYSDIVFNKTTGLCSCHNIFINGQPINIQIRKTK